MRIASLVVAVVVSGCQLAARAPLAPELAADAEPAADAAPALRLVRCAPAMALPRTAIDPGSPVKPGGDDDLGGLGHAGFAASPGGVSRVIAGSPTVTGPLDRVVVERMVRSHLPRLRACYERELAAFPAMTGTVIVTFAAGPDGRVGQTSVLGSGVSSSVSACAVEVMQALQFPTGQPISVSYPFQFATGGGDPELPHAAPTLELHPGAPWTPFALGDEAPTRSAPLIARAIEGAIRRGFGAIAGCFSGPAPRGSLRAMIAVRGDGTIDSARTGGLGDAAEACVAQRLAELRVLTPASEPAEIACDFARGEARPGRVAPVAGYTVLEAGPRGVRHGEQLAIPGVVAPRPLPADQTFLVVASPDTPGAMIELALEWAEQGDATLIALRDGVHPPLVVGVARTAHQIGGAEPVSAWPALRVSRGAVTACVDRASQHASLGDPVAVDGLVRRVAARCRGQHCSASLGVTIDADATAIQLLDVAGAARRAGFERVLLGSYAGCVAARPTRS